MPKKLDRSVWDPFLIVAQIVTMQCVFYLAFGVSLVILNFLFSAFSSATSSSTIADEYITLDMFMSFRLVSFHSRVGIIVILAYLLTSISRYPLTHSFFALFFTHACSKHIE